MKKILILAGEESGVLYANGLAGKLAGIPGGCEVSGYSDYGFDTADLAVIGIWAVVRRLFYFLRVRRTMRRAIREWRPDAVCTIDYPGMNLPLARYAKSLGIRAVHVVCPQVWAWKKGRIPKIEKSLDRLCCFFPFEPALFKPGFAVFTGHPLADAIDGARRPAGAEGTAFKGGAVVGYPALTPSGGQSASAAKKSGTVGITEFDNSTFNATLTWTAPGKAASVWMV